MKKAILDTSFIMSAVRNKLDFFEKLEGEGFHIVVPKQVIKELTGLGDKLSLKILEKNKFELLEIEGKDADSAIVKFSKNNSEAIVATLDRALQKRVKNKKLVIRQKKKLEIR